MHPYNVAALTALGLGILFLLVEKPEIKTESPSWEHPSAPEPIVPDPDLGSPPVASVKSIVVHGSMAEFQAARQRWEPSGWVVAWENVPCVNGRCTPARYTIESSDGKSQQVSFNAALTTTGMMR